MVWFKREVCWQKKRGAVKEEEYVFSGLYKGKLGGYFVLKKLSVEYLEKKRGRVYVFSLGWWSSNPRVFLFFPCFFFFLCTASFRLLKEFMSLFVIMIFLFHQ